MITDFEALVLVHTANTGRYVSGEKQVIEMGRRGLLFDHGAQSLAAGDHYLTMTVAGRAALSEWRAAQPKPRVKRRRRSRAFEDWMNFRDAGYRLPFDRFLAEVWPERKRTL
ncbi:MAG TPA: hypothetical protein VGM54_10080 [Chthoniobacter sp.]|jgi:hypothetical protein